MNFFIFIIMKAICIQSTFNKCTILATTDLQQINTSRLDHNFAIFAKSRENLLKFKNIQICYFLRKLGNSIFFNFSKILKNAEKFEYFIPQKIPQPIFQTLCRTKKFRKVSFP